MKKPEGEQVGGYCFVIFEDFDGQREIVITAGSDPSPASIGNPVELRALIDKLESAMMWMNEPACLREAK